MMSLSRFLFVGLISYVLLSNHHSYCGTVAHASPQLRSRHHFNDNSKSHSGIPIDGRTSPTLSKSTAARAPTYKRAEFVKDSEPNNAISTWHLIKSTLSHMLRNQFLNHGPNEQVDSYKHTASWVKKRYGAFNLRHALALEVILRYAMLSGYAYCAPEDMEKLTQIQDPLSIDDDAVPWLPADNKVVHQEFTQGRHWLLTTSQRHRTITAIFRGLDDNYDRRYYITPGDLKPVGDDLLPGVGQRTGEQTQIRMRSGFLLAALKQVVPADKMIDKLLKDEGYSRFKVILVGHSMGGVLARTLAERRAFRHQQDPSVAEAAMTYTYAEATSSTRDDSDRILRLIGRKRYVRVISYDDIIPHLRGSADIGHARLGRVVYLPDPEHPDIVLCDGDGQAACGATRDNRERTWTHHNIFGGLFIGRHTCQLAKPEALQRLGLVNRSEHM